MSATDRQNRLLLAEDWKRVYQSFRNADFQSYDFENLRRTMINYLRENYPEDFNDYIESSEYLALIDLIAYMGQNISFRIDLNARENYLELAERRESVLRLARLLSYNPKRNQSANGLLKIESISTSEEIIDSNNVNLARQTIVWNDPTNLDWYEQFIKVMNVTLPANAKFGRPIKKDVSSGIPTQQYRMLSTNDEVPVYSFSKAVDGRSVRFEIVSTDVVDTVIQEEAPFPGNNFAFLYRDDGRGNASSNTGFFSHFREGSIDEGTFTIDTPSTNQVVAIDATNVNNTDVWLYKLDSFGNEVELWSKVDAVEGNNVVYNSLDKNIQNIYSVLTRVDDRISLIFSDGVFGKLPKGSFRVFYRVSKNERVIVTPDDMRGITVTVPYLSVNNKIETLTISYELKYTVDNSTSSETSASIKQNAPSTYYTQNRMVTAEDYQIAPLGISQEIIKVKSINRTSSGISRYFDLIDATGKYSKTSLYGTDGVLYKETLIPKTTFTFSTKTDIEGAIVNTIEPILVNKKIRNYYYNYFPKISSIDLGVTWTQLTNATNLSTGYFKNSADIKSQLGSYTSSLLKLIVPGTMVKFLPPVGKSFLNTDLVSITGYEGKKGVVNYKWVKIASVTGDGSIVATTGLGPVSLNDVIPSGSRLSEIRPGLSATLATDVATQLIDQVFAYKTFGLRYSTDTQSWRIITENNLNTSNDFSTGKTGDVSNQQLDSSWMLLFETDGETYTIKNRAMRYIFESDQEIRFYFNSSDKIYNNLTGKIVKDRISILNINTQPDSALPFTIDYDWELTEEYRDAEGYVDSKKIEVSFFDTDDDGVVDDPDVFDTVVNETINPLTKYIFQEKVTTTDGVEDYNFIKIETLYPIILSSEALLSPLSTYTNGQLFYFTTTNVFKNYNSTLGLLVQTTDYRARIGREAISFYYVHGADDSSRLDPSSSNLIDTYILTRSYDTDFRAFLNGSAKEPLPASSDALALSYNTELSKIKSLSDEIIYHPVTYKVLFGNKATADLQASFKVVKNPDLVLNDNDIKSRIIAAINEYFALENWDFGDKFFFSEMANYVMSELTPDLVTFLIVPTQTSQTFGSLFEIKAESDQIFISGATVNNVDVIDAITASRLRASGTISTATTTVSSGIKSV
tara:strand:+ start:1181 stop:4597 length:3417 start_codon:yes stop_codon:yes gene_type:complete